MGSSEAVGQEDFIPKTLERFGDSTWREMIQPGDAYRRRPEVREIDSGQELGGRKFLAKH